MSTIDHSKNKEPDWFKIRGLQLSKMVQTISDADNIVPVNNKNVKKNNKETADA